MEKVYLASDILINYILEPTEPEEIQRQEQAAALIQRIESEQVTAYLSDVVLFEAIKALEQVPLEEEPMP